MKRTNSENKLMIITGSLGQGGLEKMTVMVANYYAKKGWGVRVLTLLQNNDEVFQKFEPEVEVNNFKTADDIFANKKKIIVPWLKFLRRELKDFNPTSILCMTFKIGALASLAYRKTRNRIVVREISDPLSPTRSAKENKLLEFLVRHAKGFIFQTEWEKSCFGKKTQSKSKVIGNPCHIGFDPDYTFDNRIVCTSRLTYVQKRYDVALKIFEAVTEKYPHMIFEIYGTGGDEDKIKEEASKLKASSKIKFMGAQKNIPEKIKGARCFLMTSDFEGLSNSLLEANLSGVPCVSSDWPGVDSIIENNVNGLIYKRQNIEEAVAKVEKIIENDGLCLELTQAGVARRSEFEAEKILRKYAEVIEKN